MSNISTNKLLLGTILGSILVASFTYGFIHAYQQENNLKILMRGSLLIFSIIYASNYYIRYRAAKRSDKS
ncbi:MAG: hypothetical protein ACK41Z_06755 [Sediminibacterium sp.]|jgi:cytochrome c biogenesis factor